MDTKKELKRKYEELDDEKLDEEMKLLKEEKRRRFEEKFENIKKLLVSYYMLGKTDFPWIKECSKCGHYLIDFQHPKCPTDWTLELLPLYFSPAPNSPEGKVLCYACV